MIAAITTIICNTIIIIPTGLDVACVLPIFCTVVETLKSEIIIVIIDKIRSTIPEMPEIFINPEITEYSKDQDELEEGCLSIPEYYVPIKRSKKIKIKFVDENGNKMKLKVRGFPARVLQHETDHLNGLVIKDRFLNGKK